MARAYGIVRSKNRALLNVSVRKGGDGQFMQTQAVLANVTAQAANLTGQLKQLKMKRIEEEGVSSKAIYYIGVFTVTHEETLNFTIKVKPLQAQEWTIKFHQQFFVD